MSEKLTKRERKLLGTKVVAIKNIEYTVFSVERGEKGTIVDFGSVSGDPIISWEGKGSAVAPNSYIKMINE